MNIVYFFFFPLQNEVMIFMFTSVITYAHVYRLATANLFYSDDKMKDFQLSDALNKCVRTVV